MIESKVVKIISDYTGIKKEDIKTDMDLIEDLNINSYDIMSLIGKIEEEFKIKVPDRDVRQFIVVDDVIKYIEERQW